MPNAQETKGASGFVYTFYSYKGGVGRSMALVNIGVLMALWGKRVLLVDWDLEAPGLESFFWNTAKLVGDTSKTPGIVDLLEARSTGLSLDWRSCLLRAEFIGSSLDIISAGRKSADYRNRVQQLNWDTLFREHRIGNYINELREEWRKTYDFVLIDSRTGITDIGDICTVLLPDALVLLFVTNYQNIDGIRSVMERATVARKKLPVDWSKLLGLPVPARDEVYNEYDKSLEWKRIFSKELGYLYKEWLPREVEPSDALNKLFIPYVTNWSFGECIPVLESQREIQDPTSIGSAYARLATILVNRLEWYALEERASLEELQGTRVELERLRAASAEVEAQFVIHRRRRRLVIALASIPLTLVSVSLLFTRQQAEMARQQVEAALQRAQEAQLRAEMEAPKGQSRKWRPKGQGRKRKRQSRRKRQQWSSRKLLERNGRSEIGLGKSDFSL